MPKNLRKSFLDKRKLLCNTFLMSVKDLLKTIIVDNQTADLPKAWARNLTIPLDSKKLLPLSGVRRSGKTYHLFNLINCLKLNGVAQERILYLNFEDERLHIASAELDLILQAYRELYPQLKLADCYFSLTKSRQSKAGKNLFPASTLQSVSASLLPVQIPGFYLKKSPPLCATGL